MTEPPLQIETVRIRDLPAFAVRAAARADGGLIAIPPERALSQSTNPFASGDEIGLIVAYREQRCVGYMGLFPGRLWDGCSARQVFWMSTWLVAPDLRGTGAGFHILAAALELGYDLFGTMFTASAGRVLRDAGFREFGPLEYYELNLRKAAPWAEATRALRRALRKRPGGWGARAARVDSLATLPVKALIHRILARRYRPLPTDVAVERVEYPAAELAGLSDAGPPHFVRGSELVNWMLRAPWVRSGSGAEAAADYHFSHLRRSFEYVPVRFHAGGAAGEKGFLLLSVTDTGGGTAVKVLDHVLPSRKTCEIALALALRYAADFRADSLVVPAAFGALLAEHPLLRWLAVRRERWYLFRPADPRDPLAHSLTDLRLSYVDGDVAFT